MLFPVPTSFVLAVAFVSPWLLAGLVLAGIPLLIHLLHKRQFKETSWAAMRFLIAATRRNAQYMRLQQLLLLLLRTLAIVLLFLAFARPYFESAWFQANNGAARTRLHVLLIDTSHSMQFRDEDASHFQRAREIARRIVSAAGPSDGFQLFRISEGNSRITQATAREQSIVRSEIDQLQPTFEVGKVAAALHDISAVQDAEEFDQTVVYVISDFQRANWQSEREEIAAAMADWSSDTRLSLISVATENQENSFIKSASAEPTMVVVDEPAQIFARIGPTGVATDSVTVQLIENDTPIAEKRVDSRDAASEVVFDYVPKFAGLHRLELRLPSDGLTSDDTFFLPIFAREQIDLLLVNGWQSGRAMGNATDFIELSLNPEVADSRDAFIRTRVITDGELLNESVDQFDCVFLCNISMLTEQEATLLSRYVANGGGLVICCGDQVQPENYNRMLGPTSRRRSATGPATGDSATDAPGGSSADGLLPATLFERRGNARQPTTGFAFESAVLSHPLMSVYRGNPGFGLENVLTFEYFRAAALPGANVALQFENGDPCLVERTVGRGRVVLVTTAADSRRWSTWNTIGGTFTTLINEIVQFAIRPVPVQQGLVGDAFEFPVPELGAISVTDPSAAEHVLVAANPDDVNLSFAKTSLPGFYSATTNSIPEQTLGINVNTVESNLQSMTEAEFREDILPEMNFSWQTEYEGTAYAGDKFGSSGRSVSRWLLATLFAILLIEQMMAWKFQAGLMLLIFACLFLLVLGFSNVMFATVITSLVAIVCFVVIVVRGRFSVRQRK